MQTLHWKLCTQAKIALYRPPCVLKIYDKSYYTDIATVNCNNGYGRIIRPRTELSMHIDCIAVMNALNWKLVAQEWCVSPGVNHHGQGDLVFQRHGGSPDYLVMEVKRRKSKYVYTQAEFYARKWKELFVEHPAARVYYGVWTSYTQEIIGKIE